MIRISFLELAFFSNGSTQRSFLLGAAKGLVCISYQKIAVYNYNEIMPRGRRRSDLGDQAPVGGAKHVSVGWPNRATSSRHIYTSEVHKRQLPHSEYERENVPSFSFEQRYKLTMIIMRLYYQNPCYIHMMLS